ncbi:MAG: class I SAM-dependent methyltransferase [Candidatus Eisenbacteria bacterium]
MKRPNARTANKNRLYEISVQNPDEEVRFIRRVYRKVFGSTPTLLREDFCGSAALCCRWVRSSPEHRAVGIDLDAGVLEWARRNNLPAAGRAAARVRLVRGNVLSPPRVRPHVVTAMNFSYFTFKERPVLLSYFRKVRRTLHAKGLFFLDIYGGPEAQVPQIEEIVHPGFSYLWDQDHYNPVTGDYRCFIHFRLPGGTRIRKAFRYDWRLWSLPEAIDLLREAGFKKTWVYWEGTTPDGEGDGIFRPVIRPVNDPAWIAYIVAK